MRVKLLNLELEHNIVKAAPAMLITLTTILRKKGLHELKVMIKSAKMFFGYLRREDVEESRRFK